MKRLFFVTFCTLLGFLTVWFLLSQLGKVTPYKTLDHPILKFSPPVLFVSLDKFFFQKNKSLKNFKKKVSSFKKNFSEVILIIDIVVEKNQIVLEKNKKILLKNFLKNTSGFFVLNLKTQNPHPWRPLLSELSSQEKRMAITSPSPEILNFIRNEKPLWTYIQSETKLPQMVLFSSLFLEALIFIKADLLILPLFINKRLFLNERLLKELQRKNKRVVLKWNQPLEKLPKTLKTKIYGLYTERPDLLIRK